MRRKEIKNFTLDELKSEMENLGERSFRATQIFFWLYKKGVKDFKAMFNLPEWLRNTLSDNFYIDNVELIKLLKSEDNTEKYLLKLEDGSIIESVLIFSERNKITECISSQVGCKYNCKFCESGKKGFFRNLSVSEIINQVLLIKRVKGINPHNIVFMGIGEPLDNFKAVIKSIYILNSKEAFNIGARKITISTCGIIPAINKLQELNWQIELSISLHAPEDKLRSELMPVNRKYPLKELLETCKNYVKKTNRQITFEYILIEGVNDSMVQAEMLTQLLQGYNFKVNLIIFNPLFSSNLKPSSFQQAKRFKDFLIKKGIKTTIRKSKGDNILAACGQLKALYQENDQIHKNSFRDGIKYY